jgi:S1-C subfamily serine protease
MAHVHHGITCREVVGREGQPRQRVVIERIEEKSPAAKAGLKKGDIILALGRKGVFNRFDVERAFWNYQAGDRVEATVLRNGKETQVALALTRGKEAVPLVSRPASEKPKTSSSNAQPVTGWR